MAHEPNPFASFTSAKLDWLTAVAADDSVQPYDFRVAFVIAQHINQRTGVAKLSDATIMIESAGGSTRTIKRSRERLRRGGWLRWQRTRTANVYSLILTKTDAALARLSAIRDARRDQRQKAEMRRDGTWVSPLRDPDGTPVSLQDGTPVSLQDGTPVSPKHLRGTP